MKLQAMDMDLELEKDMIRLINIISRASGAPVIC